MIRHFQNEFRPTNFGRSRFEFAIIPPQTAGENAHFMSRLPTRYGLLAVGRSAATMA
jgi:hypothetical protein